MTAPSKKRILFVDDEAALLKAFANLFRKKRHVWDVVFVTSGAEALSAMATAQFDVIVTDMRMPGMSGSELLTRVRSEYPGVGRIILSGYAESEALSAARSLAHLVFAKPCNIDELIAGIDSTSTQP
jgi:CheY-like chemotaxis protein